MKSSGLGEKHDRFLAIKAIMVKEIKEGWRLACASSGVPADTKFFAGETDTAEWKEYNNLMANYLGFCRNYEKGLS